MIVSIFKSDMSTRGFESIDLARHLGYVDVAHPYRLNYRVRRATFNWLERKRGLLKRVAKIIHRKYLQVQSLKRKVDVRRECNGCSIVWSESDRTTIESISNRLSKSYNEKPKEPSNYSMNRTMEHVRDLIDVPCQKPS